MESSDRIIEIRDPEINVEEIMERIRARIRERRRKAEAEGLDYDKLIDEATLGESKLFTPDLLYELRQLCMNADAIGVSVSMRDRHLPLFNPLFFRLEKLLHRLAVKYVNMLAGRQITLNRSTAHLLMAMTRALEEREVRLEALEKEVAELRTRLERTEIRAGSRG